MSLLVREKEFSRIEVTQESRSEHYADVQAGRVVALMESVQALRYAKHYDLKGDAMAAIVHFSNQIRAMMAEEFDALRINRKYLGTGRAYEVEVITRRGNVFRTASYVCLDVV